MSGSKLSLVAELWIGARYLGRAALAIRSVAAAVVAAAALARLCLVNELYTLDFENLVVTAKPCDFSLDTVWDYLAILLYWLLIQLCFGISLDELAIRDFANITIIPRDFAIISIHALDELTILIFFATISIGACNYLIQANGIPKKFIVLIFLFTPAAMNQPPTGSGTVPLQEYRRDIPPGWMPGNPQYPLKEYLEKLRLWYRIAGVEDEMIGPLIAGRLYGRASKLAMALRVPRPDGTMDVGDAALVRLAVDEVHDPVTGQLVQHHIPSGVQYLINALRQAFGQQDQDLATQALDKFFSLSRAKMSLAEYSVEFEARFDEAHDRAGLVMNDVAKFYLFFKNSGLSNKTVDDIKLQVQGDYGRFQDARQLALRLSPNRSEHDGGDVFYGESLDKSYEDEMQSYWYDGWYDDGDDWDWNYYAEDGNEGEWYYEPDEIYYEDSGDWYYDEEWWPDDGHQQGVQQPAQQEEATSNPEPTSSEQPTEEYYGGKGKGKQNDGCFRCGSKWHMAKDCPMNGPSKGYGKGKHYGGGKGKSKGKKGKGWRWRPFKGKGKGYGFRPKGKSKGKGYSQPSWYLSSTTSRAAARPPLDASEGIPSTSMSSSTTTTQEFYIGTPPPADDFLSIPRPARRATSYTEESETAPKVIEKHQHDAFSFAFNYYEAVDYFMVRGEKRRGLIIDPGAASGLIGSETLRDLIQSCVTPFGKEVKIETDVSTPVSGIDGKSDRTLGRAVVPLLTAGKQITFTGEIIGGDGSLCPALVGNPSLRGLHAIMFTSWFENDDGLLVICPKDEPEMMRLLLTDSGHYILPTDTSAATEVSQNDKKEVTLFCSKVANASAKKWNDVSSRILHVFTTSCSTPVVQAEGNRMSSTLTATPRSTTTSADPVKSDMKTPEKVTKKKVHWEDHCGEADNKNDDEKINTGINNVSHSNGILPASSCAEDHGHHEQSNSFANPCSLTPTTILELEKKNNEIQEPNTEPKINVVDNFHSDDFPGYTEDMLPENVDHAKLTKRYKAIKEEFYTRTGQKPVTPYNFKKWMNKMKGRGVKWHFWEWFSGSGRLSLTMLLAGLSVGFPVDLRYGWNINDLSHQAMLREAQAEFQPGVLTCAPDCAPWSVASNSKDPQARQAERLRDRPGLNFTQNSCEKQAKHGRGFVVEQPYGSAMWTDGLQLENIPDYRKKQRVDQCMHGAVDESNNPVQKATGLGSNIKFNKTAVRCGGHNGRPHAHLCGQVGGINRTAAAAVYPRQMCQRMRFDIVNFLHKRNLMNIKTESFYECIRCQLGRYCPAGVDHTMIPGQCRHGRYAPGTNPRQKSSASASDPVSDWKKIASRDTLEQVDIQNHLEHELTVENSHYLKKLLVETINNALGLFNEASNRKIDYAHWIDNPVALSLYKEIFKETMQVKGIKVELRPFAKASAEPTLPMSSAYLRLPVHGHVKAWTIGPLEDMREMSFSQINADIDEADWMVTLYGVEHDAVPAPSTPGTHPRALLPQPALPPRQDDAALVPLPEVQERPGDPQEAAAVAEPSYEEFDLHGRQSLAPIRPSYNLRRVLERLPKLVASGDLATAKRLLVGLHERLWHTPVMDFTNLLRRAGQPQEVLALASEAVAGCVVCRKFIRLPNRPQVRAGGATVFNDTIQLDLFVLDGTTYMLVLDEATRFKTCSVPEGQESEQLLKSLFTSWIQMFGPPAKVVLDQQASLMGHETGAEFERLSIMRCPRGTTQGHGADQHTGTGLVERHVELMKLTIQKLRAELQRQGLQPEPEELGQESAMAHNQTINYGGATPCMSVLGVLPRGFYDPESAGVMSHHGALQRDLSTFERALRIRQTALAQTQQSIIEDRVARANRHRPHQLNLDEMVAGVTEVEYYREMAGDPGWRGPALLLRVDQDSGTAVLQYQGKPYLVALRFIRPYKGIYHFERTSPTAEQDLRNLMKYVEGLTDYKAYIVGWIRRGQDGAWVKTPKETPATKNVMEWAENVSKAMTKMPLHGVIMGRALRTFKPPNNTIGKLITWLQGGKLFSVQEHKNSNHLRMKKISNYSREETCIIYFYYYLPEGETSFEPKPKKPPQDQQPASVPAPQPDSLRQPDEGEMETDNVQKKRDVSEAGINNNSERKKLKVAMLKKDIAFLQTYYINYNQNKIILDFSEDWRNGYDIMLAAVRNFMNQEYQHRQRNSSHLFQISYKFSSPASACLRTAQIFKVDEETDNVTEENLTAEMWPKVEEADRAEIRQFVEEKAFKKIHRDQFTSEMVIIDARWVRKWKRYPDQSVRMKSRLCARGFLDQQKDLLTTRSTTATRLSQRLLISQAARKKQRTVESIDIAGAFLKGFSFKEIQKALKELGVDAPNRIVVILPPLNVFRHLSELSSDFAGMNEVTATQYGLLCTKPVYGLNDAPLAWQLCLHQFIKAQGGLGSHLDDCTFLWKDKQSNLTAMATTHVDDIAMTGTTSWIDDMADHMVKRFKKVSRQKLPFDHCGCRYEKTPVGYKIHQRDFALKLKPADVPQRDDSSKLTKEETSSFRSILGALLWLTATRLDIIADVSVLQSRVTVAEVKDIKQANSILIKIRDFADVGLHYRIMENPNVRLMCIHDASAASKGRSYAQEGLIIGLAEDKFYGINMPNEVEFKDGTGEGTVDQHGGTLHVLHASGSKAKRISYSTSHAETLSMVGGMEASTLVMVRLAEFHHPKLQPSIKDLIQVQEEGDPKLPIDFYGDCRDLFELTTGLRTLPQDKSQRLYILSLKECRLSGRMRLLTLIPTQCMTSDSLTKPMIHDSMLNLLTTGTVRFFNEPNHPVTSRILPAVHEYDEHDLMKDDDEILDEVKQGKKQVKVGHTAILMGMFAQVFNKKIMAASMFTVGTMAQAPHAEPHTHDLAPAMTSSVPSYIGVYVAIFVVVVMALCFERCARDILVYVDNKLFGVMKKPKVKIELPDDDDSCQPMDVDEVNDLRKDINKRKRQFDQLSEDLREKTTEAQRWEQCASEYAARIRGLQDELSAEQARVVCLKDKLELSEKNRDDAIADRNDWEFKVDHFKSKADKYLAQIEDMEETAHGYKAAINTANSATDFYKNQVQLQMANIEADMEKHRKTLKEKDKEIDKLKAEIAALRAGQGGDGGVRPSKASKTGLFTNAPIPVMAAQEMQHHPEATGSGGPVVTPQERLAAVIDKQSVEMVELKKKLARADEHIVSLRREMQQVRTPDVVMATRSGQCFHAHDCNHLKCGREQRAFVELKKCKDCLP